LSISLLNHFPCLVECGIFLYYFILVSSFNNATFQSSTQQLTEPPAPSSFAAEAPRISVMLTEMADKSQPQLESAAVLKKKNTPSPTAGLTPIEYTRSVSAQSGSSVASSHGLADPVVTQALPILTSIVGVPKQNLPHVSKLAEMQKPLVQTPCSM
jgi:hypothetical protein